MNEPDPLVQEYLLARYEAQKAGDLLAEVQQRLVKQMEAEQRKYYRWNDGDQIRKLNYVQQHITHIDEPGLRRALTAKVFDRYTKRTLDRKAMELAMDTGEVDKVTVAKFVTTVPKKPFLTYTEKETNDG